MLKKTFIVLSVLMLLNMSSIFLYSCRCNTDNRANCRMVYSVNIETIDNGGLDEKPVVNNTVFAKALLFRLNTVDGVEFCKSNNKAIWPANHAYAMMCKQPEEQRFLSEKALCIYANNDFDTLHPAGSDLKNLFVIKGSAFYLSNAPSDTSKTYIFTFEKTYFNEILRSDTSFSVSSPPLKLLK